MEKDEKEAQLELVSPGADGEVAGIDAEAGAFADDEPSPFDEARTTTYRIDTPAAAAPVRAPLTPHQALRVGAVLGGAIGDAMGHPTEFLSLEAIAGQYGDQGVTGFELYWERDGRRFAPYTDDTQMAEVVLRALRDGRAAGEDLDGTMRRMAAALVEWSVHPQGGHRAPGNACLAGCHALAEGAHWSEAGGEQAGGCGSVVRAYPFGLVFADDLRRAEAWAVAHSRLTHRDPIALAACAAMAVGVALLACGDRWRGPRRRWWPPPAVTAPPPPA
jgi:ADP-ribosylglycohydrolase